MENSEALSKPLLTNDEIREAHGLLIELDLDTDALLSVLDPWLRGQIRRGDVPGDDLFMVLHRAVAIDQAQGGQIPITEVLEAAITLRRGRKQVVRLQEMLACAQERLAERGPPTDRSSPIPSVTPKVFTVSVTPSRLEPPPEPPPSEPPPSEPPPSEKEPPPPDLGAILMAGAIAGVLTALAIHFAMPHRFEGQPALAAGVTDMIVMGLLFGPIGLALIWATRRVRRHRSPSEAALADAATTALGALLLVSAHVVCVEEKSVHREWQWLLSLALFGGAATLACLRASTFGTAGRRAVVIPALSATIAGGCAFGPCVWTTLDAESREDVLGRVIIMMYSTAVLLVSAHGTLLIRAWLLTEPPMAASIRRRFHWDIRVLSTALVFLAALPLGRRLLAEPARTSTGACTRYSERARYLQAQEALESHATEIVFLTLRPTNALTTEEYLRRIGRPRIAERFPASPEAVLQAMARRSRTLQTRLATGDLARLTVLFVTGEVEAELLERRADLRRVIARRYLDLVTRVRPETATISLCGIPRSVYDEQLGALDGAALLIGDDGEQIAIGRQLQTPVGPMEEMAVDRICPRAQNLTLSAAMRELADRCSREETEETLDRIEEAAVGALRSR